ncbi:DUF5134 domain-containing protein [Amycolatopsis tolypomycina]|uniref:DUF5134 domain-containing protein n=1 Tax=Amycolatopsis tolypomycina TaxID=208445 RepID=UPI0033B194F9
MPDWLRAAWATGFVVITAVHLRHTLGMAGRDRWWHAAHTVLAAGMAVMFLVPRAAASGLYGQGTFVFAALAVGAAGAVFRWRSDGRAALLWAVSTVDVVIMAAMCAEPQPWPVVAGYGVAVYLAAVAVAWALGWWDRVAESSTRESGSVRVATATDLSTRVSLAGMAAGMAFMLVAMR